MDISSSLNVQKEANMIISPIVKKLAFHVIDNTYSLFKSKHEEYEYESILGFFYAYLTEDVLVQEINTYFRRDHINGIDDMNKVELEVKEYIFDVGLNEF